jgi:hypothetical protein
MTLTSEVLEKPDILFKEMTEHKCVYGTALERLKYMLTFCQSILDDPGGMHESIQSFKSCDLCIRKTVQG